MSTLNKKVAHLEATRAEEGERYSTSLKHWLKEYEKAAARLENIDKFFRWNPEANTMHLNYLSEQRQEELRKAAEQKRLAQEREQREREEQQRREAELAREHEAQEQERERQRAQYLERRSRGMGMGL